MSESIDRFREAWKQQGEAVIQMLGKEGVERLGDHLPRFLNRMQRSISSADTCLAIPTARTVSEETFEAACDLMYLGGLCGLAVAGFEVANNREHLVDRGIAEGFSRLLFLDSDTLIDLGSYQQLCQTMDATGAAMVSGLVRVRPPPATHRGERPSGLLYNAFVGDEEDNRRLEQGDITISGVPFPVHYCGIAVALLDLKQIALADGPRFGRRAAGYRHWGEDWAFCRWLDGNDLEFVVDPKVTTVHVVEVPLAYQFKSTLEG